MISNRRHAGGERRRRDRSVQGFQHPPERRRGLAARTERPGDPALRPGKNVLAIHGQSVRKGSVFDAGLFLGSLASPALPPRTVFLAETLLRELRFAEAARLIEAVSQDLMSEDRPAELLDSLRGLIKGSR